MTKATRKPQTRHGTVKRLAGGRIRMDYVGEFADLGAPEIAVTGVASIERISVGQVRITYYSLRKDGPQAVVHIVWDFNAWMDNAAIFREAKQILPRTQPDGGKGDGRRREKH